MDKVIDINEHKIKQFIKYAKKIEEIHKNTKGNAIFITSEGFMRFVEIINPQLTYDFPVFRKTKIHDRYLAEDITDDCHIKRFRREKIKSGIYIYKEE